mmetsp:Transcript_16750/g.46077  ORF Transcript_16750/g.46077 Transcript_16750/m.46077 type:complete len:85 (-) Transcript_16750:2-256(-)
MVERIHGYPFFVPDWIEASLQQAKRSFGTLTIGTILNVCGTVPNREESHKTPGKCAAGCHSWGELRRSNGEGRSAKLLFDPAAP